MKESFDDGKLYDDEAQRFGPIVIRNYREVLQQYNYSRYERRFRALASRNRLLPGHRPKLAQDQFAALLKDLAAQLVTSRDPDPLDNAMNQRNALRLLLSNDLAEDEDWR